MLETVDMAGEAMQRSPFYIMRNDKKVLDKLKKLGHTYDANGVLWLKTTAFGDDMIAEC